MIKDNETKPGKVWLIGAGPGDSGLFTMKGKQILTSADAVLYDALVGPGIVAMIPPTAEKIYVGKHAEHHTMPQEEINQLLLHLAQEGKNVVRLKGGDPFLFGRGGEELELLAEHNIPYEVVPGVTSALAVPAYQGIPVTHRDFCSSVHIITGHRRNGAADDIPFSSLVQTNGTLIFLMGVAALGTICRGLLAAGMEPDMPAALLICGTTAHQERITATVSTLEEEVVRRGARTPAIIVVGKVCALADDFSWYEKMPLGGVRVLVTRPQDLISETSEKLRLLGAEVVEFPAIRTVRREKNMPFWTALCGLSQYEWLVFTSPTGVRIFFDELRDHHIDVRTLSSLKIAAMGKGTEKELINRGFYADLVPDIYDGRHLGQAVAKAAKPGDRILIPRAAIGNQELLQALGNMQVDDIPTYDTVYAKAEELLPGLKTDLENGEIDYALFTSASCVRGFAAAVGEIDFSKVKAICIGAQTRQVADALGMKTWVSEEASIDSMIETLVTIHRQIEYL